jgi:hypothetical protein
MRPSFAKYFIACAIAIGAVATSARLAMAGGNPGGYLFISTLDIQYQSSGMVNFSGQYTNECKKLRKDSVLVLKWDNVVIPGASFPIGPSTQTFSVTGTLPIVPPPKNHTTDLGFQIVSSDGARGDLLEPFKTSPCEPTLSPGTPG